MSEAYDFSAPKHLILCQSNSWIPTLPYSRPMGEQRHYAYALWVCQRRNPISDDVYVNYTLVKGQCIESTHIL